MSLRHIPLEQIKEGDLQALRDNKVGESYDIEYKQSLPATHKEKIGFLAAVSSFANTRGGDLILGIREERGVPKELLGLSVTDLDKEILSLENLTRDCIKPRVTNIHFQPIDLATSKIIMVARVPRSWAAPHVVAFEKHWRFYGRNSAGKYQLDVDQLRAAFRLSETTAERIRSFRIERLAKLVSGDTPVPVPLVEGPKFALHLIPFGAFDVGERLDLSQLPNDQDVNAGIYNYRDWRFNLDGLLIYNLQANGQSNAYSQFHTIGVIETVLLFHVGGTNRLEIVSFENHLINQVIPKLLGVQKRLNVTPPLVVTISMWGVAGYHLWPLSPRGPHHPVHGVDRDPLFIPETLIEDFGVDAAVFMRPVFNAIWNAAGWPKAMTYDDKGQWTGKWP